MWTQRTFQGTNRKVPHGRGLGARLRALEAIGIYNVGALSWYLSLIIIIFFFF